jgi:hypothetical protein
VNPPRAAAVIISTFILAAPALAQPRSIQELRDAVQAARARISDLSVSFTFDATVPTDNLFARSHRNVVCKGARLLVDHEYGAPRDVNPVTFHRVAAFDGSRSAIHEVHRRAASVVSARELELDTRGMGFFDLMMWNPAAPGTNAMNEMDLLSLLRSPNASLRPGTELAQGRPCLVVDEHEPTSGAIVGSVWIDPAQGFAPILQQYFDTAGRLQMEMRVEALHQASPGLYLPMRGTKQSFVGAPLTLLLEVDGWALASPRIAINANVADSTFDLLTSLPPGITMLDRDRGTAWVVAGRDYQRLGDSVASEVALARAADPALDQRLALAASTSATPAQSQRHTPFLLPLGIAVASLGVVGLARTRRPSPRP